MDTSLPLRPVADDVFVAPQLDAAAMAEVARLGFRSVVNNRPDFEGGPDQPTSADVEAGARAAGRGNRHQPGHRPLPVNGAWQSPEQIAAFGALLAELPRPLLCFCRSGARSTNLYLSATRAG
jgi:uncharacterized protein (TIGR01244 family)